MPWRALEDPAPRSVGQPENEPASAGLPRSALLAGGGAVLLAVAAFLLAFGSGPGGSVSVTGGALLAAGASDSSVPGLSADPIGSPGGGRALVVEVVGAIARPGVYHLAAG